VEQRASRLSSQSRVAIRRCCHDSLKQSKDTAYRFLPIESGDKVHLGGSRISEANLDSSGN
jgi:hypothetical protein